MFNHFGASAFVVDPWGFHRERTGSGHHLSLVVVSIAHHEAVPVLVELGLVSGSGL